MAAEIFSYFPFLGLHNLASELRTLKGADSVVDKGSGPCIKHWREKMNL
jgi:hypothetical protein